MSMRRSRTARASKKLQHRFSAGNAAYSDKRFDALQEDLEYYVRELERRHVTMLLLWEEYRQKHPDGYGYTQFCYHLNQHKASADTEVSLPMSNFREGGNELFIDFAGDTMSYVDLDTGEEIKCQIFVACLPASDYGYAMAVPSQSCLRHIGGVPRILVTDNLKSSVARPDRYMPELNVIMEDFANHYGCVTIPARSGHPKDKALVEDQVQIVYRRVYAPLRNKMFHSILELNTAIAEKMKQHNQKRMQRLPFTREERFLSLDRPRLRELPEKDFEIIYRTELLVQNSSHIYMGKGQGVLLCPVSSYRQESEGHLHTLPGKGLLSGRETCSRTHEMHCPRTLLHSGSPHAIILQRLCESVAPEVYRPCGNSVGVSGQFRSSTINHVTGCSISSGPQTRNSSKRHAGLR